MIKVIEEHYCITVFKQSNLIHQHHSLAKAMLIVDDFLNHTLYS